VNLGNLSGSQRLFVETIAIEVSRRAILIVILTKFIATEEFSHETDSGCRRTAPSGNTTTRCRIKDPGD